MIARLLERDDGKDSAGDSDDLDLSDGGDVAHDGLGSDSGDENPQGAAERLRDQLEMVADSAPTADGVEQSWCSASVPGVAHASDKGAGLLENPTRPKAIDSRRPRVVVLQHGQQVGCCRAALSAGNLLMS